LRPPTDQGISVACLSVSIVLVTGRICRCPSCIARRLFNREAGLQIFIIRTIDVSLNVTVALSGIGRSPASSSFPRVSGDGIVIPPLDLRKTGVVVVVGALETLGSCFGAGVQEHGCAREQDRYKAAAN